MNKGFTISSIIEARPKPERCNLLQPTVRVQNTPTVWCIDARMTFDSSGVQLNSIFVDCNNIG